MKPAQPSETDLAFARAYASQKRRAIQEFIEAGRQLVGELRQEDLGEIETWATLIKSIGLLLAETGPKTLDYAAIIAALLMELCPPGTPHQPALLARKRRKTKQGK